MALPGNVANAATGLIGFDIDDPLDAATAKSYAAQGFKFCARYISRQAPTGGGNLTAEEAETILQAGLALTVVQHPPLAGWTPTQALGTAWGANAANHAKQVGLPPGVNVWLDLEGIVAGVASDVIIAYCNAWFDALTAAGYQPGVYVGANSYLTPDELFLDLKTRHYWKAGGDIQQVSHRGYQLIQHIVAGKIDRNVTQTDALGGTVIWLSPN